MSNDTRYNGWTNYATWRVNLEMFDGIDPRELTDLSAPDAAYWLSLQLRDYADDMVSNYGNSETLALDYARAFLSDVNFREIADHMVEAYAEGDAA